MRSVALIALTALTSMMLLAGCASINHYGVLEADSSFWSELPPGLELKADCRAGEAWVSLTIWMLNRGNPPLRFTPSQLVTPVSPGVSVHPSEVRYGHSQAALLRWAYPLKEEGASEPLELGPGDFLDLEVRFDRDPAVSEASAELDFHVLGQGRPVLHCARVH